MLFGMTQKDLEIQLNKVIDELVKAGFLKPMDDKAKKELVGDIAKTLVEDKNVMLTKESLNKPEMKKLLGAACIIAKHPQLKMNVVDLFKDKLEFKMDDKKLLKEIYKLKLEIKAANNPQQKLELEQRLDKLSALLATRLRTEDKKSLIKDLHIQKLLSEQRRADYGVDTQNPGALLSVFQGVCMGNQNSRINLAQAGSENAAGQAKSTNIGSADPMGTKLSNAINSLMNTNSASDQQMAKMVMDTMKVSLTAEMPKLTPPK